MTQWLIERKISRYGVEIQIHTYDTASTFSYLFDEAREPEWNKGPGFFSMYIGGAMKVNVAGEIKYLGEWPAPKPADLFGGVSDATPNGR